MEFHEGTKLHHIWTIHSFVSDTSFAILPNAISSGTVRFFSTWVSLEMTTFRTSFESWSDEASRKSKIWYDFSNWPSMYIILIYLKVYLRNWTIFPNRIQFLLEIDTSLSFEKHGMREETS